MSQFLKNPIVWACTVGFFLTIAVFYPGFMNFDAGRQLGEARVNVFSDLHPPFLAWIWRYLDLLYRGPLLMLISQATLFWTSLGIIFARTKQWWVVLVIGLIPSVWPGVGTIQKDIWMVDLLLLMVALLFVSQRTQKPLWAWLALIPCLFAITTRHNAAAAVPPLLLWWGILVFPRRSWWVAAVAGVALTALLFVTASAINTRLTTDFLYPSQQIFMYDLVAISIDQEQVILPDYALRYPPDPAWLPYTVDDLRTMYTPGHGVPIYNANRPGQVKTIKYISQQDFYNMLTTTWQHAVLRYPISYAIHRAKVFALTLGMSPTSTCTPYSFEFEGYDNPDVGVAYTPTPAFQALVSLLNLLGGSPIFRPIIYLGVSFLLFLWVWRKGHPLRLELMALTSSAILYMAPLYFISITCEFRMGYWSVVATLIALGLSIVHRRQ